MSTQLPGAMGDCCEHRSGTGHGGRGRGQAERLPLEQWHALSISLPFLLFYFILIPTGKKKGKHAP